MPDKILFDDFDFYHSEDDKIFINDNIYHFTDVDSNNNLQIFIDVYECLSDFSFLNDDAFIIVREIFYFLNDLIEPESLRMAKLVCSSQLPYYFCFVY